MKFSLGKLADVIARTLVKSSIINIPLIKIFRFVARTGTITNKLADNGVMVSPIHYYYPVPDFKRLVEKRVFEKKSNLNGIDFNEEGQIKFLNLIASNYQHECDYLSAKPNKETDFYSENGSFSFACASFLHCIIRQFKPKRIIEVGVGNSSKIINRALSMNILDGCQTEYIAIDPYPANYVNNLSTVSALYSRPVEDIDISVFSSLEANDILFIDSSHQVKIGNDVLFLYLEVLPILKPGVIVHIHDISLPYEYPKAYFLNEQFRVCWNEQYLLQAFLIHNSRYKVLLAGANIMANYHENFKKSFSHYDPDRHIASSGSFWIQRNNE